MPASRNSRAQSFRCKSSRCTPREKSVRQHRAATRHDCVTFIYEQRHSDVALSCDPPTHASRSFRSVRAERHRYTGSRLSVGPPLDGLVWWPPSRILWPYWRHDHRRRVSCRATSGSKSITFMKRGLIPAKWKRGDVGTELIAQAWGLLASLSLRSVNYNRFNYNIFNLNNYINKK